MPQIGFVSAPQDAVTLSGDALPASAADLTVRIVSNGQPHRALPLTGSLCTAVAAGIEGSIPHQFARAAQSGTLRLAMPSGVLTVGGEVVPQLRTWIGASRHAGGDEDDLPGDRSVEGIDRVGSLTAAWAQDGIGLNLSGHLLFVVVAFDAGGVTEVVGRW